jgi:hypothetical protein
MGALATTRKKLETARSGSATSPLPSLPAVTTTVTCKRRKNTIKVSVLPPRFRYALFWFLSFSWFVDFSSAGNRSGGWVASGYYLVIIF